MEKIMPGPVEVLPVIPVMSVISSADKLKMEAKLILESHFDRIDLSSGLYPFDLSDYYEEEMGEELTRQWFSFELLRDASLLAEWKLICAGIEEQFLDKCGNRKINIDPGYLDYGKLVLASFKSAPDKIYIGKGVWAHTCLRYGHGRFTAPEHSFPDFIDGRFNDFMLEVRHCYRRILRLDSV
ncbi:DUF4416 domain-containing protein [Candidatus Fermentibacteria bacterium]|nr:MAG: DUF4416 domain-containing protein [Candidatus Fermentibacteria bacterium]